MTESLKQISKEVMSKWSEKQRNVSGNDDYEVLIAIMMKGTLLQPNMAEVSPKKPTV